MTIIKTKDNIANAGWQYVEIEVTADGDSCRMVISTPTLEGAALQAYCDARESDYKLAVLKAMYPDAYFEESDGKTDLEKFEGWVLAGHTNPVVEDVKDTDKEYPEGLIEKVSWVGMGKASLEERVDALENKTAELEAENVAEKK
jgi:hypothetical protein